MHRRLTRHLQPTVLAGLLAISSFLVAQTASAQSKAPGHNASSAVVQGPVSSPSGGDAGTFSGLLKVTGFAVQNGQIVANGLLTGTITAVDGTTQTVNQAVTNLAVSSTSGSCPILNLTLGPLHLNVLGLVVNLNQVNLNIVAVPGAGNLLGNLLCDIANLLNNGGTLSAIVGDLNEILAAL